MWIQWERIIATERIIIRYRISQAVCSRFEMAKKRLDSFQQILYNPNVTFVFYSRSHWKPGRRIPAGGSPDCKPVFLRERGVFPAEHFRIPDGMPGICVWEKIKGIEDCHIMPPIYMRLIVYWRLFLSLRMYFRKWSYKPDKHPEQERRWPGRYSAHR